jgi:hypothetical protein
MPDPKPIASIRLVAAASPGADLLPAQVSTSDA